MTKLTFLSIVLIAGLSNLAMTPRPGSPTDLTTTLTGPTRVELNWTDNSTREDGFSIERATGTGAWTQLASVIADVTGFTDDTVVTGTTYRYRVRAFRAAVTTSYSNVATIETPAVSLIGYIGCSVTVNAVDGYLAAGGTNFWPSVHSAYGAASVSLWADPASRYWAAFDNVLAQFPDTTTIWWQLCTSAANLTDNFDAAQDVVSEIRRRIPDATVFVSAQHDYTDGHVCPITGADGPARMQALADELIAAGLAFRGPVVGPLAEDELSDGCHANDAGKAVLGQQLADFFDPPFAAPAR